LPSSPPLAIFRGWNGVPASRRSGQALSSLDQYSEHLEGDGAAIFAHACKLGCEGIVSKHREHPVSIGPSKAWLKIKNPAAPGVLRFQDAEP
jgi:ATP-dependent DNA ligase